MIENVSEFIAGAVDGYKWNCGWGTGPRRSHTFTFYFHGYRAATEIPTNQAGRLIERVKP